jgi:small subunit ribosomal protein S3Ae
MVDSLDAIDSLYENGEEYIKCTIDKMYYTGYDYVKGSKKKARVVDKWKLKNWYSIKAPDIFEGKEIGQLVATEEDSLKNRIIRVGLGEITGSFSSSTAFTSVLFRVNGLSGKTATTKFIGHELSPSYLKTLLRRRRSIIYNIVDVKTIDGAQIRLKSVAVSAFKASEATRHDLRAAIEQNIKSIASQMDMNTLAQEVIFGKFSAKVFGKVKNITPMRRLEIRKSELLETFD